MLLLLPALVVQPSSSLAQSPSLAISPGHAVPGQSVRVVGSGFTPGYRGALLFDGRSAGQGTVTIDRNGRFVARFEVPRAASFGHHLVGISARARGSDDRAARDTRFVALRVVRPPASRLPQAGSAAPFASPRPPVTLAASLPPAVALPDAIPGDAAPDSTPGSPPPLPTDSGQPSPPGLQPTPSPRTTPRPRPPSQQPTPSSTPAPPPSAWREDFNSGLGSFRVFTHAWSNGQSVAAANVGVANGMLRLRADFPPQVGAMVVGPAFDHGYFEARIRYQKGTGLSPAFWLRRPETATTPWDEVDIMEAYPNTNGAWPGPNLFQSTVHTYPGGGHSFKQITLDAGTDLTTGWHTFGARLVPGQRVDIYLDGVLKGSITQGVPSRQTFEIIFSHIAGNWSAQPDGTTANPAFMDVDWVRWSP